MKEWGGDNWLKRNRDAVGKQHDPVAHLIGETNLVNKDSNILEIGCSNGWRLKNLQDKYDCTVIGIDPSALACAEAWQNLKIAVHKTVGASLPFSDELFDVVIMGFCMWLTDPSEWFRNVSESDRVLKDGGTLIIHDYCYPRVLRLPYNFDAEAIEHADAHCYFFDWPKLWLVHPAYSTWREAIDISSHHSVSMLRKDMARCA